ncbi:MAG: hypothetical protein C0490_21625 [Marivirga sp.]|nr:hypothetical protein [Marivirga sp.]
MPQIEIQKNTKLEDLESYYKILSKYTQENSTVDILVPKHLDHTYLGLIPSLYQLIFTWVRYENSGKLLLDIEDPEKTDWDDVVDNEFIFPLIAMTWNKNEIFTSNGKINLRDYLRPKVNEVWGKMKSVKTLKGKQLLLTNCDHLPEDRGILKCFEINHQFIKDESILNRNLKNGISEALSYSKDIEKEYAKVGEHLVGIVFELMKNTFDWAKDDERGIELDPNIRGLLIKFYKKRRSTLLAEFANHQGLLNYFSNDILKENSLAELYLLEVSVFDSGAGFIEKWRALNDATTNTDIEILKKCLIKHMTSAKGMERDDKGVGLDRILNILNMKGFLRIKTGKLCVYRNLINNPYKAVKNTSDMELFDWHSGKNESYTSYQDVAGALVTIVYPLSILN